MSESGTYKYTDYKFTTSQPTETKTSGLTKVSGFTGGNVGTTGTTSYTTTYGGTTAGTTFGAHGTTGLSGTRAGTTGLSGTHAGTTGLSGTYTSSSYVPGQYSAGTGVTTGTTAYTTSYEPTSYKSYTESKPEEVTVVKTETVKRSGKTTTAVTSGAGNYGTTTTTSYTSSYVPTTTKYSGTTTSYGASGDAPKYTATTTTYGTKTSGTTGGYTAGSTGGYTAGTTGGYTSSATTSYKPAATTEFTSTKTSQPAQTSSSSHHHEGHGHTSSAKFSDPTEKSKWNAEAIIEACKAKGKKFTDSTFLPGPNLVKFGDYRCNWRRNRDIYSDKVKVFLGAIEPNDIIQGDLGDCYYLSTLASIAERDYRIKDLINTKECNEQGVYSANICWAGVWTEVVIDDYFPENGGKFCFSAGNGEEIWVLILEKVWAKLHGTYGQIDGGLTREPLHDLTGAPTKVVFVEKNAQSPKMKELWNDIVAGDKLDFIMTCGSVDEEDQDNDELKEQYGLVCGHAYSMLGAYEIDCDGDGSAETLVKLRNPWSELEWKGRFSDDDKWWDKVNASIKQQIGYEGRKPGDGIFFIDFKDFVKFFTDAQICMTHQGGGSYTGIDVPTEGTQYFKIDIPTKGIYFFQACQQSIRTQDLDTQDNPSDYYGKVYMIIAKEGAKDPIIKVCGGTRDLTSWEWCKKRIEMDPGIYYAAIKVEWKSASVKKLGFGVYGSVPADKGGKASVELTSGSSTGAFEGVAKTLIDKKGMGMEKVQ